MSFSDISGNLADRLKKNREKQTPASADKPVNFKELYALRARIHGLLIRDARLARGRSVEECAASLGLAPETLESWELGMEHPSLPELELLAYELGIPVSHFWSNQTLTGDTSPAQLPQDEYVILRSRLIGALLRQARQNAELSLEALSEQSGIPAQKLNTYELGQAPIPLPELTTLASVCKVSLNHFTDAHNRVGHQLELQESFQRFQALDEPTRAFLSNPSNQSFLHLAMWFSQLSASDLRGLAESILNLSRLDGDQMRRIAEGILNDITL